VKSRLRLTDRDARLLEFAAEHRLVLGVHAQALLGSSPDAVDRRLRALAGAGLLVRRARFQGQPGCFHITRAGLAAIGSALPAPREDLRCYAHDVGVAWLWLAGARGTFGAARAVVGERRMRSLDGAAEPGEEHHGVRLGGVGPAGSERRHYPDLLLVRPDGSRVALELELSAKGRLRREGILAAYGADPRIRAVLYLTDRADVARAIRSSAESLGVARIVHVQRLSWDGARPGVAREARSIARTSEPERAAAR
jgi:hypothetical protein